MFLHKARFSNTDTSQKRFEKQASGSVFSFWERRRWNETFIRWIFLFGVTISFGIVAKIDPAHAQTGNWTLKRDPCSETLLARYYGMLERNPNDGFPMKKLRACRSAQSLIKRYEARVKNRPGWHEGHVILGHLYVSTKKLKKAVDSYKKAIEANPKAPNPHLSLGDLFRKQEKPGEALKSYERSLSLAKKDALKKKVLRQLIDLSMAQKKMKKARSHFKQLIALEPKNTHLRGEFARMLARNLNYDLALKEFQVLLKQARGNNKRRAALLKEVGEVYEKMGKDPEAIKTYRRAMKLTTRRHWLRKELVEKVIAIYRRKGDIKSLAAHYEKSWKSKGLFEWQILAQLYDELGRQEKAVEAYKKALAMNSSAVDTRDKLISLLERAGRHVDAMRELEKQVRLAPGEPRYLLSLAEKYWRAGQRKKALAQLKVCGRRFPRDGSVQVRLADLYSKWGYPDLAMRQYQILVRIEPHDPGHIISLGEQYWQRGKKKRALSTWKTLLRPGMFSTREEAYATLGSVYANHEMLAQGIKMYNIALKSAPKNPALYKALGPIYKRARQYDKAVEAWQKVIKLATEPSKRAWRREARTSIITLWHSQGKLKNKLASYEKSFRSSPPDIEAGYFLGEAYIKLKKLEEGEKIFNDILKADSEQQEALLALQDIYQKQYKLNKAIQVLKRLAEVIPNRAREFYMRIAELSLLSYKDEMALSYVKKALKLSEGDAHGWARIARIYEQKEDYEAAIKAYKRALKIRPRFFKVHFDLAKIYLRMGKHHEASELYHEVVQRSSDEHMVSKAGSFAVDLDEYLGNLDNLERALIPLAFTYTHKPVYRKLLVKVYSRMIPALVRKSRYADAKSTRESAKQKLKKIGTRALKPLLEALSEGKWDDKLNVIDLLGHLGNPGAAPTLVRMAISPPVDEESISGDLTSRTPVKPPSTRRVTSRVPSAFHPPRQPQPSTVDDKGRALEFRVRALVSAGRLSNPQTIGNLVQLLKNDEVAVRETAAWALALMAGPKTYKPLVEALNDRKIGVQVMACIGLGLIGSRGLKPILQVLKDINRREEVRAACAFSVGLTKDRRGVQPLLNVLSRGRSQIQHKAAIALGLLADSSATIPMLKILWTRRGDIYDATRWAVLKSVHGSLGSMNIDNLRDIELGSTTRLPLIKTVQQLGPDSYSVPAESRALLIERHSDEIIIGLKNALSRHRDVLVRVMGILDATPDRFSLGYLDPQQDSPSTKQNNAAEKVVSIGESLKPVFADLSTHKDETVRSSALRLLGKTGAPEDTAGIKKGLQDKHSLVRMASIKAAALMAERHPTTKANLAKHMISAFEKLGWEEQREAIIILGRIKTPSAISFVVSKVKSENGFIGEAAVETIGKMKFQGAEEILISALQTAIEPIRLSAAAALTGSSSKSANKALRDAASSDVSPRVRKAAIKALNKGPS